jgi:hypothetical protein
MQAHQSFTDLCVFVLVLGAGKLSMALAQVAEKNASWIEHITGPLGALFAMAIGIWWLSNRNSKMDAERAAREAAQDLKDEKNQALRTEELRCVTEALTKTAVIVEQNQEVLRQTTRALDKHHCHKEP